MTLEDAVAQFEAKKEVLEAVDAPKGAKFLIITSGGQIRPDDALPALFTDENEAVEQWLGWVEHYAHKAGGHRLFWEHRPRFEARDYVGLDQASMIGDSMWRGSVSIRLGCVWSKLFITGKDDNE